MASRHGAGRGAGWALACLFTSLRLANAGAPAFHYSLRDSAAADTAVLELQESTARAAHRAAASRTQSTLSGKALEKMLGRNLGDALTAFEGVALLQSGPTIAKPEIHGLQGNRIQILNNGTKLEGQQWGSEHAPEVDPFLAGSLTVIKGAAGVRYGPEALGGVVLVTPRPLRTEPGWDGEWHALATTAGRGGATALRYDFAPASVPGLALRVQGTLRRLGDQETPDYVLKNTGMSERNASATAGYGTEHFRVETYYSRFHTDLGILSASHIGNLTDLRNALDRGEPEETGDFRYAISRPRQSVTHDLAKVKGDWYGKAGTWELSYSYQDNDRSEYDKHRPLNDSLAALNRPELRFVIATHQAELLFEQAMRGNFSGQAGATASTQGNASLGRAFIPNFRNHSGGLFALERWNEGPWGGEAGLRYDYRILEVYRNLNGEVVQSDFDAGGWSGALGGTFRKDSSEIRLNLSSAWRPPSANELYSNGLHHGAAAVEYGDTKLRPETAYSGALSFTRRGERLLEARLEGFATYIRDYIGLIPEQPPTLTIRGAFPTFRYRSTDALLNGLDARLVFSALSWLDAGTRGSLLWARDWNSGDGLLFTPSHRWENSLTARFPGWKGFSEPYVLARAQTVWKKENPAPGDYAPPPEGYTLLHAEAGIRWMSPAGPLDAEIQVRNLLDRDVRDYTNRFRYFADDPGREIALRLKLAFGSGPGDRS